MKTLGLVITDGVGFRNYVLSDFLNEAQNHFDKVIIFSGLPKSSFDGFQTPNCYIEELEDFKEKPKVWFFRKLKEVAHLQNHKKNNFGIQSNLKIHYPRTYSKRSIFTRLIFLWTYLFHSEAWISIYYRLQRHSFKKNKTTRSYIDLLKTHKPDKLFFTHQRPPYIAPLILAANTLKIKTITFIFSWDNLASKGRMSGDFDNYFVWSDLMKKELLEFYSRVKDSQVHVVGTPQFESYVLEKYVVNEDAFYDKFSLDKDKRVICYSCADSSIGRNDEVHIRAVLSYINSQKDLQLLVRTSPAEDGKRFKKLMDEFPEVKWNMPKWIQTRKTHSEMWSQRLPTVEDVLDLKSVLLFSDVNINMLSTMSLDFMIFGKPVINVAFGNLENGLYNDQKFLKYTHYKYVIDSGAVAIAKNELELHKHLTEALEHPEKRKEYRQKILDFEIGKPILGTSKRIIEALKK